MQVITLCLCMVPQMDVLTYFVRVWFLQTLTFNTPLRVKCYKKVNKIRFDNLALQGTSIFQRQTYFYLTGLSQNSASRTLKKKKKNIGQKSKIKYFRYFMEQAEIKSVHPLNLKIPEQMKFCIPMSAKSFISGCQTRNLISTANWFL